MSLKVWFMYDNHTFARVEEITREELIARGKSLFDEDGCGSMFVRDAAEAQIDSLTLHGHMLRPRKWGVTKAELAKWADAVVAERSFRTLMV
jgi:hypothetical protein